MEFLLWVFQLLRQDIYWLQSLIFGSLIFLIVRRQLKFRGMPPGPWALPLIGNLLDFRTTRTTHEILSDYRARYGDILTIWLGFKQVVVIFDWNLAKEATAFGNPHFTGRLRFPLITKHYAGNSDIAMVDVGPEWKTLRKTTHQPLRQLAVDDVMANRVCALVDELANNLLSEKSAVNPKDQLYMLIFNFLCSNISGKCCTEQDKAFKVTQRFTSVFSTIAGSTIIMNYLPFLTPLFKKQEKILDDIFRDTVDLFKDSVEEHSDTFNPDDIRDVTDSLLLARADAQNKNLLSKQQQLKLDNLNLSIINLFTGGGDTMLTTCRWMILILANYPEIQDKIYQEVQDNIGQRSPTADDKKNLHYVNAFVAEVLRFRIISPFGIPRRAISNTTLGGHNIPKDTTVLFYVHGFHHEPTYWVNPEQFLPDRFLDSEGRFLQSGFSHYAPFGFGRRICIGDKLSLAALTIITARFIQRGKVQLEGGPLSANLEPLNLALFNMPQPYKIIFEPREIFDNFSE